jgi:hypothetical protein
VWIDFADQGVCENDQCVYDRREEPCAQCAERCTGCAQIVCPDQAGGCLQNGHCDPAQLRCVYDRATSLVTACTTEAGEAGRCLDGACVDCIEGVTQDSDCNQPPGDRDCFVAACKGTRCTYEVIDAGACQSCSTPPCQCWAKGCGNQDGAPCSKDEECASGHCREAMPRDAKQGGDARSCAAAAMACAWGEGAQGSAVGYRGADNAWLCAAQDVVLQCDLTRVCQEFAGFYCDGARWLSGSSDGKKAACPVCAVCGGTPGLDEGELGCTVATAEDPACDDGNLCRSTACAAAGQCANAFRPYGTDCGTCLMCDGAGNCDVPYGSGKDTTAPGVCSTTPQGDWGCSAAGCVCLSGCSCENGSYSYAPSQGYACDAAKPNERLVCKNGRWEWESCGSGNKCCLSVEGSTGRPINFCADVC